MTTFETQGAKRGGVGRTELQTRFVGGGGGSGAPGLEQVKVIKE